MLDPMLLRTRLHDTGARLKTRGYSLDIPGFERLEAERKGLAASTQALQAARNAQARAVGVAKARGEDVAAALREAGQLAETLRASQARCEAVDGRIRALALDVPNLPLPEVPMGTGEADNREIARWGEVPSGGAARDHVGLGERHGWLDAAAGAGLAGARFTVLRGALARLHRALGQFMLDMHTGEHGYVECSVPLLVGEDALTGTGQLPRFADDLFGTRGGGVARWLVPTAEVPLTNLVRGQILDAAALPLRLVALTPCFRAEAGAAGRDTRGMLRQHQFEKVELVQVVEPARSREALEELTGHAEAILRRLELPYRKMLLCTGDMGFAAAMTYDLEVWLPSQNRYREISSCSNCTDFQARRMQARWRDPAGGKARLVHTLNGSGVAVGRCLVAVMENFQNPDGSITVPEALRPYMGARRIA